MRLLTSLAAILFFLATIVYAPFSHVHAEGASHSGAHRPGIQLHSHISAGHRSAEHKSGPSAEAPPHEGRRIDLFLSIAETSFPGLAVVDASVPTMPRIEVAARQGALRPETSRDPPVRDLFSRPPPPLLHS